jgi:threonine dehydrogenase-like Zn-dependent dehydrogenase
LDPHAAPPFETAASHQHATEGANVNPDRPGSAYGYVDMGGWVGGQAEYVLVPYADWNLLKFPDKDQALEKILDLAMLSDIFPTGFHGCITAGVGPGSTVYVAGAGPVGLAAATSAQLLGAAVVIVGNLNADRLAQAATFGCETVDISKGDPKGPDRADPGRPRSRRGGGCGGVRGPRPRRRGGDRTASDGAQHDDGHHARRRADRHPGFVRHW